MKLVSLLFTLACSQLVMAAPSPVLSQSLQDLEETPSNTGCCGGFNPFKKIKKPTPKDSQVPGTSDGPSPPHHKKKHIPKDSLKKYRKKVPAQ
ncbi:hypothetical protein QVD99_003847 [Batrachochytrium dendrobatidis]|nr:hypothetical protein QVD99_003847 [Batrachochytrium dendrobatidis]